MSSHFAATGAQHFRNALSKDELALLERLTDRQLSRGPATRLAGDETLTRLLAPGGTMDGIAKSTLGDNARPVRAVIFDKRPQSNWAIGWHQDRTIAVKERRDVPGFEIWSKKAGITHVEAPFDYLADMVTLRAHLDDCDEDNAPLLVAPGSHRHGRLPLKAAAALAQQSDALTCLAHAGDVWIYATTIVHASRAARAPKRRRVLHVDYSAARLPNGLEWLKLQ